MLTHSMLAHPRRRKSDVPRVLVLSLSPTETPAEHVRNALALLVLLVEQAPAVAAFTPELSKVIYRCQIAVQLLEARALTVPVRAQRQAIEAAVEALAKVPLDWDACPDIPAVTVRLLRALWALPREEPRDLASDLVEDR